MSTGGEVICTTLEALGVECVFGVPGTQNVELFEALRRSRLKTVLATHELAAAFMANGYYRASGRVAALVTIPGPGFTYALTGIAEARADSAALLYIVGRPPNVPGRHFQLQAIDQASIARPLAKDVVCVTSGEDLGPALIAAHRLATQGEPGPVIVQVDPALLSQSCALGLPTPSSKATHDVAGVRDAEVLLRASRRPVFLLGQGAFQAASELREIVEHYRAPVITTPSARGVIPEDHPQVVAFDAIRDDVEVINALLEGSDLIVALGSKLGHNGTGGFSLRIPPDRLVHIDASGEVLGANYPARLAIEAPVEAAVTCWKARIEASGATASEWSDEDLAEWRERRARSLKAAIEPRIPRARSGTPAGFFGRLRELLPREAILVTDSGLHQMLARRHYSVLAPRGLVLPSDFQSMGFGLPAAIGAKLAEPNRPVVALVGDGGFQMSGMEILTAVREGLELVVIVFNDGQLNLIRMQQFAEHGHAYSVRLRNPDFEAFAGAVGAEYLLFDESEDDALKTAFGRAGVTLVEVVLGDSAAVHQLRASRHVKAGARGLLGGRVVAWLKARRRNLTLHAGPTRPPPPAEADESG